MTPEDVPAHVKAIVDEDAGRAHSSNGAVMTSLARVLTEWNAELAQRVRAQYQGHPDADVASWIADYLEAGAPTDGS